MCFAILRIKHRVGESSTVNVETEAELAERIEKLKVNEETVELRVYLAQPKLVRTTAWETFP